MKKLFSILLLGVSIFSIFALCFVCSAKYVTVDVVGDASYTLGRASATSRGTLWSSTPNTQSYSIGATTHVYLYYTKDGSEKYYADYREATAVNASQYYNMTVSVAKWSTDGSSNFHSRHVIYGLERGAIVTQKTVCKSNSTFGGH